MAQILDNPQDALRFAMKLIALRRRSEAEIRQRLREKECPQEIADETVRELYKFGYLDDEAFAESYINDRMKFRPAGRFLIKMELQEKGIAPDIVERKLEELLDAHTELEMAEGLLRKKLRTAPPAATEEKTKAKLVFYLRSRGFSPGTIQEALSNIFRSDKQIIHEDE